MSNLIDVSMFFNEVELLKARLESLNEVVDKFIVIESNQSFKGDVKQPILPGLVDIKKKFGDKLVLITRNENYLNYQDLLCKLSTSNSNFSKEEGKYLCEIMASHDHYDKSKLHLLLDTFQREACSIYIKRLSNSDDLIIFSDADELPDNIDEIKKHFCFNNIIDKNQQVISLRQHEFWYYPNIYHDSQWEGSLCGSSSQLTSSSLNWLRLKNGINRMNTNKMDTVNGYHLTNMGGIERLRTKIKNWTHQEYNNNHIINSLEKKIIRGEDIFMRKSGTVTKLVKLNEYYSESYRKNILASNLPLAKEIMYKKRNFINEVFNKIFLKIINKFK